MNKIRSIFLLLLLPTILFGQQEISNAYLTIDGKLLKNASDEYLTKRTPWVFQTAASETQLVISTLNISSGGQVNINWGDGTSNTYTGSNSSITKNYSLAGQYTVSIDFGDYTKINFFRLFNEDIDDDISNVNFGNLTNLIHLYLYSNNLTGSIPPEIGNLTNLQRLFLYSNNLTGSIPPEIGNLTNLQQLFLYFNIFTDIIPDITQMSSLTVAQFQGNSLTGIDSIAPPDNATLYDFNSNDFPSSEVNEVLEDCDASITAPTANLTLNVSGPGMGNLPDGAANTFLVSLSGKYTTAGQTLTVLYNTP